MADVGRPTVVTKSVLDKLEEVFSLGGTDKEACLFAGINPSTLYNYQEINPEFVQRKALLKETPVLLARRTVTESLAKDTNTARWYIERRDRDFNPKNEIDITSKGESITATPKLDELIDKLEHALDNPEGTTLSP